jgi:hypothetical protein
MNELDLIRSFRADVPLASAAATARAERAWRRPDRRRPGWAPRATVAAGLVAAAAAAALMLPSDRGGRLGTQEASAAGTLRLAAAAQAGGVTRPLKPGEYWYARRRNEWPIRSGGYTLIQPEVREDWVGTDGSRHWRTRPAGPPRFPGPRHRERWVAAGSPSLLGPSDHRNGATSHPPFFDGADHVSYAELLELPRERQALYRRLRATAVECECGNGVDEETFVIAGDLLRDNPLPADLRAAILRAAALIPGIELVDGARDVAGRRGVGVAFDGTGARSVLIFDPKTYELLGENDGGGGSADLESVIVDSINAHP